MQSMSTAPEPRRPSGLQSAGTGAAESKERRLPARSDDPAVEVTIEHAPSVTYIVWNGEPWAVAEALNLIEQQVTSHSSNQPVRILLPTTANDPGRDSFMNGLVDRGSNRDAAALRANLHHHTRRGHPLISNTEALLIDGVTQRAARWGVQVAFADVAIQHGQEQAVTEANSRAVQQKLEDPNAFATASDGSAIQDTIVEDVRQNLALRTEARRAEFKTLSQGLRQIVPTLAGQGERVFALVPALAAPTVCPERGYDSVIFAIDDLGRQEYVERPKPAQSALTQPVAAGLAGGTITQEMAERFLVTYLTCRAISQALPPSGYASFRDLANDRTSTDIAACVDSIVAPLSGFVIREHLKNICAQAMNAQGKGRLSLVDAAVVALERITHRITQGIVARQRSEIEQADARREAVLLRVQRNLQSELGGELPEEAVRKGLLEFTTRRTHGPIEARHREEREQALGRVRAAAQQWLSR